MRRYRIRPSKEMRPMSIGMSIEDVPGDALNEQSGGSDIQRRLEALRRLFDQRLITQEEYEEKRKEILREL